MGEKTRRRRRKRAAPLARSQSWGLAALVVLCVSIFHCTPSSVCLFWLALGWFFSVVDTVRVIFGQKYSPVAFLMLSENRPPPPSFDDLRKQWLLARLAVGVQRLTNPCRHRPVSWRHASHECPVHGAGRATGRAARDGSRAGSSSSVFRSTERLSSAHWRLIVRCDYVSRVIGWDMDGYYMYRIYFYIFSLDSNLI